MQLWGKLFETKVHVFSSKDEPRELFFREEHDDKSLANDKPLDASATKSASSQGGNLEFKCESKTIKAKSRKQNIKY